jgi:hypothetical protein
MNYLLFLTLLLSTVFSFAQDTEVLSKIPATGKTIGLFIPAGYDTIMTAYGDMNKDGIADYAMVLKSDKEDTYNAMSDTTELPSRVLLLLFKNEAGYSLAAKTTQAIMAKYDGGVFGDPFESVGITKGILIVQHYGGSAWRWAYTHKFRYQNAAFYLIGQTSDNYWNVKMCNKLKDFAGTDFEDINFITGSYEKKRISEDCKLLENKKGRKAVKPLVKLEEFTFTN